MKNAKGVVLDGLGRGSEFTASINGHQEDVTLMDVDNKNQKLYVQKENADCLWISYDDVTKT